jgi:hypothetical protein
VNSFSSQNVNVVAATVSHVLELSAVLWVRVARIWVAPVRWDPGERRQMEAVESLIGDGVGPGRWLEQQGAARAGTRVVVFPAGSCAAHDFASNTHPAAATGTRGRVYEKEFGRHRARASAEEKRSGGGAQRPVLGSEAGR